MVEARGPGRDEGLVVQPGRAELRRKAQSLSNVMATSLSRAFRTESSKGSFTLSLQWDPAPSHRPSCAEAEGQQWVRLQGLRGDALPRRLRVQSHSAPFLVIFQDFEPNWAGRR